MKCLKCIYIISIALLGTFDLAISQHIKRENIIAIHNANVIPMNEEGILINYSIIIRNGIITEIGSSGTIKVPKNAEVIDAKGKYLIPGLSDMHVHLEGQAWNIIYPREKKFSTDEINYNDILFLYLANGVTLINVMSGFPEHIAIRDSVKKGNLLGPRILLSRMIDGADKAWPPPISTWVNNPQEAKLSVIDAYEMGYDRIKVYSFLSKESYDTIIATAEKLGMPVDGHIPVSSSVEQVAESGQRMIAHSEEMLKFTTDYSPDQIDYFSSLLSKSNIWLTATLTTSNNMAKLFEKGEVQLAKPGTEYLHPQMKGIWEYLFENLYKPVANERKAVVKDGYEQFQKSFVYDFYRKGGKLLSGTDALVPTILPGFSIHDELLELVNVGLTPFEALRVSTTDAHRFLGDLEIAGTIEKGKVANLVLLNSNPLKDISNTRNIYGVFSQETFITAEEIKKRLFEINKSYENLIQIKKMN
ncbi:MAG: amidohydrolase family protein [Saprospiraceae bacterium]|nr:amidohydrolase family protein [Saprospiraceae bacterium]